MWLIIGALIGLPIIKYFVKKQADGEKATMAVAGIEMVMGLMACFADSKKTVFALLVGCLFVVAGVIDLCELLFEKAKAIETKLWALESSSSTTTEKEEAQGRKVETDSAYGNADSATRKIMMRDVNNGWKCVRCGAANPDSVQYCTECKGQKLEPRTGLDGARQARIIDHNVVCPACGTMQEISRKVCRNCATKFVSAEVLSQE